MEQTNNSTALYTPVILNEITEDKFRDYQPLTIDEVKEKAENTRAKVEEAITFMNRQLSKHIDICSQKHQVDFDFRVNFFFNTDFLNRVFQEGDDFFPIYVPSNRDFLSNIYIDKTEDIKNAILKDYAIISVSNVCFVTDMALLKSKYLIVNLKDFIDEISKQGFLIDWYNFSFDSDYYAYNMLKGSFDTYKRKISFGSSMLFTLSVINNNMIAYNLFDSQTGKIIENNVNNKDSIKTFSKKIK